MTGTMRTNAFLLGSSLVLWKGQKVKLIKATNLPSHPFGQRYFARPADGKWSDRIERREDDSILLDEEDIIFTPDSCER